MNTIRNLDQEELIRGKIIYSFYGSEDENYNDAEPVAYTILGFSKHCKEECTDCLGYHHRLYLWRADRDGRPPEKKEQAETFCVNSDEWAWNEEDL